MPPTATDSTLAQGLRRRERLAWEQVYAEHAPRLPVVLDDVVAEHGDTAGIHARETGEDIDERGFAGAVRPEQAMHLGLEHIEVDTLERLDSWELLNEVPDLQDFRHWTTSPRRL